ncbi:hypothetical protein IWX50DRAFT_209608 [Phyllosticta citricarpa]|uniref:Uncharacterized protein n=1 Tax=Phyllosticta citricarpa TaxID=55181 RepID=A0ABR1MTB9_9PEZI
MFSHSPLARRHPRPPAPPHCHLPDVCLVSIKLTARAVLYAYSRHSHQKSTAKTKLNSISSNSTRQTVFQDSSTMPLPIYTSEKPSTSETNTTTENSGAQQSQQQTSSNQTNSSSYQNRPKSEAELAAEKLYEERMEEEYAKREGGA